MGEYILFNNSDIMKTGESPSHTVYASARGLGKLANILANKGRIDD